MYKILEKKLIAPGVTQAEIVAPEIAKKRSDIIVLDADVSKSTCTRKFGEVFPDRFFNIGVAEMNMASIAAGLATTGKTPVISTFATFIALRALEPIRSIVSYANLNVKMLGGYTGLTAHQHGPTHHCLRDIAIMRALPNVTVLSPSDWVQTGKCVEAMMSMDGPCYLRLGYTKKGNIYPEDTAFSIGKSYTVKNGSDLTILSTGVILRRVIEAAEQLGRDDLRTFAFDCTKSWVYPDAGESAGWYVLHRETATKEDDFIRQRIAPARLGFEQKTPHEIPPLTVFEWGPQETTDSRLAGPLWAAPVEWSPAQAMSNGTPVTTPLPFDGPLTFEGYEVSQDEQTTTLVTYWRVKQKPERPFSLMAHLVDAEGHPVAVADGLGVPWEQLQPGDLVMQRHVLSAAEDVPAGSYWPQTGAYWLDTMTRFPILAGGQAVGDRLLLSAVDFE